MGSLMLLPCLLLLGAQAPREAPVLASAPLLIADQGRQVDRQGRDFIIAFALTNRSSQPISAYAVVISFTDASGSRILTQRVRSAVQGVIPVARPDYAPGEVWADRAAGSPRGPDGSILAYSLEVDYVLFADGTSWGSDRSRSGPYFEGLKEGARMMRGIMRDKLEREGPAAIREFLLRP